MTGLQSCSLGAEEYRWQLSTVGLAVATEYEDEGQNHYFDAFKDTHYTMLAHWEGAKQA